MFYNTACCRHVNCRLYKEQGLTLSYTQTPLRQKIFFENIVAKGEIARDEQYLPLPHCFKSIEQLYFYMYKVSIFLPRCVHSHLLQMCCVWGRVK